MKTLPQFTPDNFFKKIKKHSNENINTIQQIEKLLIDRRGYVLKMPKPGSPVILEVSGGLDSVVSWAILLEYYKLKVYPIFLKQKSYKNYHEYKSVLFFAKYFKKRYPILSQNPKIISINFPKEFEDLKDIKKISPEVILNNLDVNSLTFTPPIGNEKLYTYPFFAMAYANQLNYRVTKEDKIFTIFVGITPKDSFTNPSQSLTALRTATLSACVLSNNYNWQITSILFEKEVGNWMYKTDIIKTGYKLNIPLEKSWSCFLNGIIQCGNKCASCKARQFEFKKAGVHDKTFYLSTFIQKLYSPIYKFKHILKRILISLKLYYNKSI